LIDIAGLFELDIAVGGDTEVSKMLLCLLS